MNPEGRLQILLFRDGDRVGQVTIRSSRPLQLPRVFHGQTPQAVLEMLPRLYGLCGTAQAAAALLACRQALRLPPAAALSQAQAMLVIMETAREHLRRLLIDWAGWLGEQPDRAALVPLGEALPGLRRALFGDGPAFALDAALQCEWPAVQARIVALETLQREQVFGMPPDEWLGLGDLDDLQRWLAEVDTPATRLLRRVHQDGLADLGRSTVATLPALPVPWLERQLGGAGVDAFIARPLWQAQPGETGPLQRQQHRPLMTSLAARHGNGLLTRLVARLLELAETAASLRQRLGVLADLPGRAGVVEGADAACEGAGIGQVEAARGRLVHRLTLISGRVRDYRILAPTEWNFHPDGALARGLKGVRARTEAQLRDKVALLINAIDPCVGYELELH